MIFGVRHGERADRLPPNSPEYKAIEISFDPHLSQRGVQQAEETGRFIQSKIDEYQKNVCKDEEKKEVENIQAIIISSPFLRTIQTAFAIGRNLKSVYQNTIFLQEDMCEYLQPKDFKSFPLDTIYYKTRKTQMNKYVDTNQFQIKWNLFQPKGRPSYPENIQKADVRIAQGINLMKEKYFKEFDTTKFVIIYVTHQFTLMHSALSFGLNETPVDYLYCAILQILYPQAISKNYDIQDILISGLSDHIKHLL